MSRIDRAPAIPIPSPSLVVMVGPAGSGKTSFCRRNFLPTQVVSSDACRALLCDDPADQEATAAAFDLAHRITAERLRRGRLTVFDATNVTSDSREALLRLAERHHLPAVACVLSLPADVCARHDRDRPDRRVGRTAIARQARQLAQDLPRLGHEGFAAVHRIATPRAAAETRVDLVPLPCDRSGEHGPFDIIGDVHGCAAELIALLRRLGYERPSSRRAFRHPGGRRAVFVGDLVDRGPRIVEAARLTMRMVAEETALCVPGNHEAALLSCLDGGDVTRSPGLLLSLRQIDALGAARRRRFLAELRSFVAALPSHLVLDGGRLAVAHAGLKPEHIGRDSAAVRRFALSGETTGEVDRYGLPVRVKWAVGHHGRALVVYGHTPVSEPEWIRNTVNIDTGCVYGGKLTALRYPELKTISVPAPRPYYRPRRSLPPRVGLRAETRVEPGL
ncbi:MAG TPA: AAA family ATPase [Candidatus Polarisedimenticolia bacterium]|nr:AAA family ATPase [Candidatus Polarisedimenticolia bacterium]